MKLEIGMIFVVVGALAANRGAAQEGPPVELEPIVVTATRVAQPFSAVALPVTVFEGDELRALDIRFVADALAGIGGAEIVRAGSFGAVSSLFMRGGESDFVKVLIDGVPVNDPGGSFDFSGLTTDNVERIEVVQGPSGVLYGSDAIAGVVQVFTRRGSREASGRFGVQAGTYGSRGATGSVAGGTPTVGYSLAIGDWRSAGIFTRDGTGAAFNNDYRNTTLSGRVDFTPAASTTGAVTTRYRDGTYHFPTDGAGNLVDRNSFTGARVLTIGASVRQQLSPRWAAVLLGSFNRHDGRFDDSQDDPADTLGFFEFVSRDLIGRRGVDLRIDYRAGALTTLTLGGSIEHQSIESASSSNSEFGPGSDSFAGSRSDRAVYAQILTGLGAALSVNAGARLDDHDGFGTHFTYRGGAVLRTSGSSRLRAAVGTGFKEPTFFENFATGFATGNPDLKPEESFSAEGGVEHDLFGSLMRLGATYYYQQFTNLVQYTFAPVNPGDPNYFNVGAARSSGIQFTATATPLPGLSVGADLTLMDTEVTDAGFDAGDPDADFAAGERLLRRPATQLGFRAGYAARRGSLNLTVRHTGDRIDRDFSGFPATRVTLDPHTLVDVTARLRAVPGAPLTLTLGIANLTDRRYLTAVGFPAPGRAVYAGADLEF